MNFLQAELNREFSSIGFKNQRRNLRVLEQTAKKKTDKSIDSKRDALLPGKRISKAGNVYWETRTNRSDARKSKV